LGLILFARHKYDESNKCLARSFELLSRSLGSENPSTIGPVFNFYDCAAAQGWFVHKSLPPEFYAALPQISDLGNFMMLRKAMIVALLSLLDLMGQMNSA